MGSANCNASSHWLSPYSEWSLYILTNLWWHNLLFEKKFSPFLVFGFVCLFFVVVGFFCFCFFVVCFYFMEFMGGFQLFIRYSVRDFYMYFAPAFQVIIIQMDYILSTILFTRATNSRHALITRISPYVHYHVQRECTEKTWYVYVI